MAFEKGHALLIGVGLYSKIFDANVPIAAVDAQAVAEVLKDPNICGYPSGQVKLLLNESATKAGTLAALDELAGSAGEDDTVFLFYCGHGAPGEDGNYYFISHDAQAHGGRAVPGTGLSEAEFIDKLRAIKAKRVLVTLNTCYSGNVSPSLGLVDNILKTFMPPQDTTSAILATGTGRIIITAAGEDQRSYIGKGQQSIFAQALIDGLHGKGVANRHGYISAFDLYEHIYETVLEAVEEEIGVKQEPELTVLKGVGPFAVSLYRGASSFGDFDTSQVAPQMPAVRQVKPEKAEQLLTNIVVGGNFTQKNINTGGGAYIDGNVNTGGGDFINKQTTSIQGDQVSGDKVGGDKITVGDVYGTGIGIGRGVQVTVQQGASVGELAQLFSQVYQMIEDRRADPSIDKQELVQTVQKIEQEADKGETANPKKVEGWLRFLATVAPDILKVVAATLANPIAGVGTAISLIATKVKAEAEGK